MNTNAKLKLGLAALLAGLISAPLAFAQGGGSDGAMDGMMQEEGMMQGEGMMDGMSEMMGMMQMMQQMGPMMEACTEMMQAMTNQMNSAPDAQGAQDDQG